jgi:aminoglycoside phosphotransferase (APT) family kinase protein
MPSKMIMPDEAEITRYLSDQLATAVTIRQIKQTYPGASRETWLINAIVAGEEQGLVLRIDPPEGHGGPAPMKQEFMLYERLFKSEVPVAEPLWYGEDSAFAAGRPHMVRRLVEGSSSVAGLFDTDRAGEARRRRVAFECVEKLAMVHRLDWKALGLDEFLQVPASAGHSFAAELETWSNYWHEKRPFPSPVLEATLHWLRENLPADTPRISLVKGNNGLGEEIWRDEKIVAMSDWEVSCLGDGISDLFWSQGTVRLIGFEDILRHYESIMGQTVSMERLTYANLFAIVKQLICGRVFWYIHFHEGRTNKPYSLATQSFCIAYEHKLAHCLGKPLDEAWHIINGGEKSMYLTMGKSA